MFPMPHFRELKSESLKVWCWLVSTVLWLVVVERQLDLLSMTARLRGGSCVVLPVEVCHGGGTVVIMVPWWYLVVDECVMMTSCESLDSFEKYAWQIKGWFSPGGSARIRQWLRGGDEDSWMLAYINSCLISHHIMLGFEVIVLLEEVELFLRWKQCLKYDVTTPLLPWEEILADIVQDKKEVLRITNKNGILLDRLAWWLIQHAKEIGGERATRGLTLCLTGVFLFHTNRDFLLYEHVGILSLLWHGQSLAPAVLAHLYSSLTMMSLGRRTCGSLFLLQVWMEAHLMFDYAEEQPTPSKIFLQSSVYCSRAWYEPEEEIKCVTTHLKSRDA
ncbi:hypothetical protein Taro_012068 [Colocasia esculenta]|uniref:Aminotransferase-like plant mobile domain-containing protein n=1 Tax=Colocasia esculenta TaxID=4460 RepID=A0A843U824_COLES|nr:hypothetical protein [Colocasia esculenta]